MQEEWGSRAKVAGNSGIFDIRSIEPRSERWHQLMQLALGLAGIWLGYEIATWASDPGTISVRLWTLAVVVFGLVQVGRAVSRFVVSVSSRQERVFRCRHLAACGAGLLAAAVALVVLLLARGPLNSMMSHGSITGTDIADVGFVVAAGFCLVGAVISFIAAVVEFRSEHELKHPPVYPPPG